jgi:acid phosphatase type 7
VQRFAPLLFVVAAAGTARADVLRKGPYLQNVTADAITVMWQADASIAGRVIVEGPGLPEGGRIIDVPAARFPRTRIEGLRPASRYRYRVEVGTARDKGEFATAPPIGTAAPFTFVAFGDNGSSPESHRRVIERAAADVPDFILGVGDMVNTSRDEDWQMLFEVERPLLRDNVIFPALGNHDQQRRGLTIAKFSELFSLPDDACRDDAARRYYTFTYGTARFLILDSNSNAFALTDQTAWIEGQLVEARQDPRIRHVFVAMHHPPYSLALHGGNRNLRERWTPLFEKYGVAAVFSGHDHVYERAHANGVHYFVTGGGGAVPYKLDKNATRIDRAAVKRFEAVNHYLRVTVDGDQIDVAAVRRDGTLIESTVWGEPDRAAPVLVAAVAAPAVAAAPPLVLGAAQPPVQEAPQPGEPAAAGAEISPLGIAGAGAALLAAITMLIALRRTTPSRRRA